MTTKHFYPMEGVHISENERNGFTVFELHYSADPAKRDPNYIKHIREGMPIRQFQQEYELQWDSFEGLSVFADWDKNVHSVKSSIRPHLGLPLFIGCDFGLTPAFLVAQLQGECLKVIREWTAQNMGVERFFHMVVPQFKQAFPSWSDLAKDCVVFIDASGMFRKDTNEGTCAQIIQGFGFKKIIPGAITWEERRMSVEHFLTRRTKEGSCIQISEPDCPVLFRGFQGGYRYPDKVMEKEPNKIRPIKDMHSHVADALQMITSKLVHVRKSVPISVPRPYYSWTASDKLNQ